MDVVSQALHVAANASDPSDNQVVSLEFDLDLPAHRAAYAAAMAVLAAFGEAPEGIAMPVPARYADAASAPEGESTAGFGLPAEGDPLDEANRRAYRAAMDDLVGDPTRAQRAVADTFPLVRDILRDGANIEGVAQVQYMRWTDAQRAVRSTLD